MAPVLRLLFIKLLIGNLAGFVCAANIAVEVNPDGLRKKLPVGSVTPAISMGATHGVILASDGSLWVWGTNYLGWPVLGLGNTPSQPVLRRIGNDNDWVDVSTSPTHTLALKANGTLWAWGENLQGQLGNGPGEKANRKQGFPVPSAPGNDWKQVAAGGTHSLGLKTDGTLWAWGNSWAGQLGTGTLEKETHDIVQIGTSTNWQQVWAGGIQTVGLQRDGTLWFWGSLTGSASDTNRFFVPTRISDRTNWVDVSFGYFNVFAIQADGSLWTWGRNAGFYTGAPIQPLNPVPARVGNSRDWQACGSSGYFHHLIKKRDGSLWALDAYEHRMVNKPQNKPAEFRKIDLSKEIVAFDAGRSRMVGVALTRDGEVWTWGQVLGEPASPDNPEGLIREIPWLLPNVDPSSPPARRRAAL